MAYNRSFNPDALPAFAEPERKNTGPPATQTSFPPRHDSHSAPVQQANYNQQYNKPQPPIPPPQENHRKNTFGHPQQGGRLSPAMQPPGNYGYGTPTPGNRPPPLQSGGRPAPVSRPPPSPAPGSHASDPALLPLFRAVDKDGSGQLTENELRAALVNGDWSNFDPHTVRMMIRMFDTDLSGSIDFDEFCGLWSFLASWRTLFDRFDVDRSGNISLDEYTNALVAFGYRLSPHFTESMFRQYDKRGEGAISFDLFVQSCISLKRMTDVFKKYDDDRDGYITLSFEDFLMEIIRQK